MLGLLLRARRCLVSLGLVATLSAISGGSASAQPAPPGVQAPAAQPVPPPGMQPAPGQPGPPPGAQPYPNQPWYPPDGSYQPWVYYPQYGYGYDTPYLAPPPPPKEPYNRAFMTAGIIGTIGGILALLTGSVVVATSKDRIDVYCDGPTLCAHLDDQLRKGVGIGLMVGGGAVAVVGLPLWIIGGRKVPVRKKEPDSKEPAPPPTPAALNVPVLRVGPTGASLAFSF